MGFNNKVLPTNPNHYHGLTLFQDNDFNNNNSINASSSIKNKDSTLTYMDNSKNSFPALLALFRNQKAKFSLLPS